MSNVDDFDVLRAMERYGGGFIRSFAALMRHADHHNFSRLKAAFPDYWEEYKTMAELDRTASGR